MICSIEDRKNKSLLLGKEERPLAPPLKLWKHVDAARRNNQDVFTINLK
tara:strand:- start:761 stop:907 length:147 start_codon:yes stop_codon:yes gene_type:complete